jgi:hypothetical protein
MVRPIGPADFRAGKRLLGGTHDGVWHDRGKNDAVSASIGSITTVRALLTVTVVLEVATGVALLTAPSLTALLLLWAGLETPGAVLLASAVLAYGAVATGMNGVALWPAIGAHLALLIWWITSVLAVGTVSGASMEASR